MDMKAPSPADPKRPPLDRTRARNAALINQLGTPGLGSLMAGRYIAGAGQLVLFLTGFCLFVAWFISAMLRFYHQLNGIGEIQPKSIAWLGEAGASIAAAAWLWSLLTSISLLRQARSEKNTFGG